MDRDSSPWAGATGAADDAAPGPSAGDGDSTPSESVAPGPARGRTDAAGAREVRRDRTEASGEEVSAGVGTPRPTPSGDPDHVGDDGDGVSTADVDDLDPPDGLDPDSERGADGDVDPDDDGGVDGGAPIPPRREIVRVAQALRVAVLVLSVPAVLLALVVAVPVGAVIGVSGIGLVASGPSVLGFVGLGLGLAAMTFVVIFLGRVRRYRLAVRPPDELATDLRSLFRLNAITRTTMDHLVELSSPQGGLRPLRRARALWKVLRTADTVEEHVTSHERARWFVPPDVALTWVFTQVLVGVGVVAAVLAPVLAIALASSS